MNKEQYTAYNMNNNVIVKLTDKGIKHLNSKYESKWIEVKEDGTIEIQLWCFMELFGDVTGIGMAQHYDLNIQISNQLA